MFLAGCTETSDQNIEKNDQKEKLKTVLNNLINGNYEAAFEDLIDSNGKSFSHEIKENITSLWESTPDSQYKIINESDISNEFLQQTSFTEGKQFTVEWTFSQDSGGATSTTQYYVVKYKEEWKIFSPEIEMMFS